MFQTGGGPMLVARRVLGCPACTGCKWIISIYFTPIFTPTIQKPGTFHGKYPAAFF